MLYKVYIVLTLDELTKNRWLATAKCFITTWLNHELQQEYVLIKYVLTPWAIIMMCLNNKIYKCTFKQFVNHLLTLSKWSYEIDH